jgi:hypothetical protein
MFVEFMAAALFELRIDRTKNAAVGGVGRTEGKPRVVSSARRG